MPRRIEELVNEVVDEVLESDLVCGEWERTAVEEVRSRLVSRLRDERLEELERAFSGGVVVPSPGSLGGRFRRAGVDPSEVRANAARREAGHAG